MEERGNFGGENWCGGEKSEKSERKYCGNERKCVTLRPLWRRVPGRKHDFFTQLRGGCGNII